MSEELAPTPFEPYACSLGTVTGVDGDVYLITKTDGRVIGVRANGELSVENIEADIASPAPDPVGTTVLSPLQILSRLTAEEEAALTASTDLAVAIVRNRLIAATEVRSDDPRTAEGASILVAKGILTDERAEEVFPL